jgi:hypothetical protein
MALPVATPIERRRGFTPLPNQSLPDWPRLVSGDAQMLSILFINSELHLPRKTGEPALKWTRPISKEELAAFVRCTVRAIEIAFKDLLARKVLLSKKAGPGVWRYAIPFETWPELPDRPWKVVPIVESEQAEEETEEEAKKPRGEVIPVYSKPQKLRAGTRSRPKDVPGIVGKLQLEAGSEIEFDARLCDGILTVRAKGELAANEGRTKGAENRNTFRKLANQATENTDNSNFPALHQILDNYCLRHHGTIPNDKLLGKIQASLGETALNHFWAVIQARIRGGKVIPMALFINLAEDAARGAKATEPTKPKEAPKPITDDEIIQALTLMSKNPSNMTRIHCEALLSEAGESRVQRIKAMLQKSGRQR